MKAIIIMETKLAHAKEMKEKRIKAGLVTDELQNGQFVTSSGKIIYPEKKLDKDLYRNIVLEEKNRQLKLELKKNHERINGKNKSEGVVVQGTSEQTKKLRELYKKIDSKPD